MGRVSLIALGAWVCALGIQATDASTPKLAYSLALPKGSARPRKSVPPPPLSPLSPRRDIRGACPPQSVPRSKAQCRPLCVPYLVPSSPFLYRSSASRLALRGGSAEPVQLKAEQVLPKP